MKFLVNKKILDCFVYFTISLFLILPLNSYSANAENNLNPPVISGIDATVFDNYVEINFSTDVPSNGYIEYWIDSSDSSTTSFQYQDNLDYSVRLSGLSSGNLYNFKVKACLDDDICAESSQSEFVYGSDNVPPSVDNIYCPEYASNRMTSIYGLTKPLSTIGYFLSDELRFSVNADNNGFFSIPNAPLLNRETTEVKLVITDIFGNVNDKVCEITVDSTVPSLTIDSIPSLTNQNSFDISLTSNKPVNLKIFTYLKGTSSSLESPENLELISKSSTEIKIGWDDLEDSDMLGNYVVYRDGIPISIVSSSTTEYSDTEIISGVSYNYKVSAVDDYCRETSLSNEIQVQADTGNHFSVMPKELINICSGANLVVDENLENDALDFSSEISLSRGTNVILVYAIDDVNNVFDRKFEISMDDTELSFESLNLNEFSDGVVFTPYVTIRGKTSRPSNINITLNKGKRGEETYILETSENGRFSKEVDLVRSWQGLAEVDVGSEDNETDGTFDIDVGFDASATEWPNSIKVTAVDNFGNSVSETGVINYGVCAQGDGHDLQITIPSDSVTPNEFIPRHLIEGIAVLGFVYELSYPGYSGDAPKILDVRINQMPLAPFHRRNYNLDWIADSVIPVNTAGDFGYAQVRLRTPTNFLDEGASMYDNETKVAKTNEGNCYGSSISFGAEGGLSDLGSPIDTGCVKLPLIIEVDYEKHDGTRLTQKECIDFSIMITPVVDPRDLQVSPFLEVSASILNEIADAADWFMEQLIIPMRTALIGCISSYVGYFVSITMESFSCVLNGAIMHASNPEFYFEPDGRSYSIDMSRLSEEDRQNAESVQSCFDAKVRSEQLWLFSKYVCRRMMCGAIPSFETYVKSQHGNSISSVDGLGQMALLNAKSSYCHRRNNVRNIYAPNNEYPTNFLDEKLKHEGVVYNKFGPHERVVATFLHESGVQWAEAKADDWCEEEYQYEYKPGCLLYNPYKRSLCTAYNLNRGPREMFDSTEARNAIGSPSVCGDQDTIIGQVSDLVTDTVNKLNFCSSDQRESYGLIFGEDYYWIQQDDSERGKTVYLLSTEGRVFTAREEQSGLLTISNVADEQSLLRNPRGIITLERTFIRSNVGDACEYPDDSLEMCHSCAQGGIDESSHQCCPIIPATGNRLPPTIAREVCGAIPSENPNIIDPTSNLIDSTACVCLTAVNQHLARISRISRMLANCFEKIAETGSGSAGICQQLITTYVCDWVYGAIGCFTSYAGSGIDVPEDGSLSFRNIGDALALAGSRTQSAISNEYGNDALFRHIFDERNFFNSVCLFAFTGEWPGNFLDSALEAAQDVVPTEPLMTCSATRRFQTFDPVSGIATYVYNVAPFVDSGAPDTNYKIELLCSTEQGSDCIHVGHQMSFDVTGRFGNGRLSNGQTLNDEQFIVVDELTDRHNNGHLRYDKVKITATYTNNNGELTSRDADCRIRDVGGNPPAFCDFDVLDMRFSCRIVGQDGAVYFSESPRPKSNILYLGEPNSRVEFNTYSVRVMSRPNQPLPSASLRIRVFDNNGNPVRWTGNRLGVGDHSRLYRITSQDLVRFGEGSDNPNLKVPSFSVSDIDVSGGGRGTCRVYFNDTQENNINCIGDFDSVRILKNNDNFEAEFGIYSLQSRTFTRDDDTKYQIDSSKVDSGHDNNNDRTIYNITFDISGANFVLRGLSEDQFPLVVRNQREGRRITGLEVEFALLDENGAVIVNNLEPQEHKISITLRQGTRDEYLTPDHSEQTDTSVQTDRIFDDQTCMFDNCRCGSATCNIGERCCARRYEEFSGVGYCIPSNQNCDTLPPILSEIEVNVARERGFVMFKIDDFKDESNNIEGRSPGARIYIDLEYKPDPTSGEMERLIEDQDRRLSFFTTSAVPREGLKKRILDFETVEIAVIADEPGCYEVYFSAIDSAGNYQPKKDTPHGKLRIADDGSPSYTPGVRCFNSE